MQQASYRTTFCWGSLGQHWTAWDCRRQSRVSHSQYIYIYILYVGTVVDWRIFQSLYNYMTPPFLNPLTLIGSAHPCNHCGSVRLRAEEESITELLALLAIIIISILRGINRLLQLHTVSINAYPTTNINTEPAIYGGTQCAAITHLNDYNLWHCYKAWRLMITSRTTYYKKCCRCMHVDEWMMDLERVHS